MPATVLAFATGSMELLGRQARCFPISLPQARTRRGRRSITSDEKWQIAMSEQSPIRLDLEDIQSGALHERPSPYFGTYLLIRIDQPRAGRELVRRLLPVVDSSRSLASPPSGAWVTVA